MELLKEYFTPWILSNVVGILILVSAIRKPRLARLLFVLLFSWACWINYTTAHDSPTDYLNYASLTPFATYESFINGWFENNIVSMVTFISIGQALIAIGMLLKGLIFRIACFGAIIFFIAISPLGIGSGFPFPIICLVAIYVILKKNNLKNLWIK